MLAQAIGLFRGGEDAIQEALAETFHGVLDAGDFDCIDAGADDHAYMIVVSGQWSVDSDQ